MARLLILCFFLLFTNFTTSIDPPQVAPGSQPTPTHTPAPAPTPTSPNLVPPSYPPAPPPLAPASPPLLAPSPLNGGESSSSSGLNGGQKAGIAIGVVVGAGAIGLGGLVYKKRRDNIRRSMYGSAARRAFL